MKTENGDRKDILQYYSWKIGEIPQISVYISKEWNQTSTKLIGSHIILSKPFEWLFSRRDGTEFSAQLQCANENQSELIKALAAADKTLVVKACGKVVSVTEASPPPPKTPVGAGCQSPGSAACANGNARKITFSPPLTPQTQANASEKLVRTHSLTSEEPGSTEDVAAPVLRRASSAPSALGTSRAVISPSFLPSRADPRPPGLRPSAIANLQQGVRRANPAVFMKGLKLNPRNLHLASASSAPGSGPPSPLPSPPPLPPACLRKEPTAGLPNTMGLKLSQQGQDSAKAKERKKRASSGSKGSAPIPKPKLITPVEGADPVSKNASGAEHSQRVKVEIFFEIFMNPDVAFEKFPKAWQSSLLPIFNSIVTDEDKQRETAFENCDEKVREKARKLQAVGTPTLASVYDALDPPSAASLLLEDRPLLPGNHSLVLLPLEVTSCLAKYLRARELIAMAATCTTLHRGTARIVPGMKLELYDHQMISLTWMQQRERTVGSVDHPLFKRLNPRALGSDGEVASHTPSKAQQDSSREHKKNQHQEAYANLHTGKLFPHIPRTSDIRGGLLCDEPGLGKTITCLALILRTRGLLPSVMPGGTEELDAGHMGLEGELHPSTRRGLRSPNTRKRRVDPGSLLRSAATLIVVPGSLLGHWQHQVSKITAKHGEIFGKIYWDLPNKKKLPSGKFLAECGVVVTDFRRLSSEWKYGRPSCALEERSPLRWDPDHGDTYGNLRVASKNKVSPLLQVYWLRVIVDEGHALGTLSVTNAGQMAACLEAERRWVMTGTPTPNTTESSDLRHLLGLFRFLRDHIYGGPDDSLWNMGIGRPMDGQNPVLGARRLNSLLSRVMVRHTKDSIQLPRPLRLRTLLRPFRHESDTYNTLVSFVRANLLITAVDPKTPGALHKDSFLNPNNRKYAMEAMTNIQLACCGGGKLIIGLKQIFWVETLNYLRNLNCDAADVANVSEFLRRAVTNQDTACARCGVTLRLLLVIPCAHLVCCECTSRAEPGVCGHCGKTYDVEDFQRLQPGFELGWSWTEGIYHSAGVIPGAEVANVQQGPNQLNTTTQMNAETLLLSSKAQNLVAKLTTIQKEREEEWEKELGSINRRTSGANSGPSKSGGPKPVKAIVFTQYVEYLHRLELFLRSKGVKLAKFHGRDRANALQLFQDDPTLTVLLLGKDGSHGLDLSFVSHVFLMDEIWDKSLEDQVISRAYRMGCAGRVVIDQLILEGTVEYVMHQISTERAKKLTEHYDEDVHFKKTPNSKSKNNKKRKSLNQQSLSKSKYKEQAKILFVLENLRLTEVPAEENKHKLIESATESGLTSPQKESKMQFFKTEEDRGDEDAIALVEQLKASSGWSSEGTPKKAKYPSPALMQNHASPRMNILDTSNEECSTDSYCLMTESTKSSSIHSYVNDVSTKASKKRAKCVSFLIESPEAIPQDDNC